MIKHAGILSIGSIGAGIAFGIAVLILESLTAGLSYIGVTLMASYIILMNYCRKCPHSMNDTCNHLWPGKIAKKMPYKKTGKYTFFELFSVFAAVAVLLLTPVAYMVGKWVQLGIYLGLWIAGAVLLRSKVCPGCYNRWCMLCPNRVK